MFSKNKQASTDQIKNTPSKPSIPSIISGDLVITGDMFSEGEIQIDGTINGDIKTATLLVGETARINGDVNAKRVRVHGHVNGQITAQSVTLAQTAHVTGDVIHEDLSIEKGAFLEGHCKRISEKRLETAKAGSDKPPHLPIQASGNASTQQRKDAITGGETKAAANA
ncbi:MAG: polymer-forming cytoskeletal protein [Rhodospirillales bacterium]|jgi:cytoskeletal protein CcmA (bactofilin family)|nr:polymer-forming cytoskeletal protein [Rhodospirillales bacterium]